MSRRGSPFEEIERMLDRMSEQFDEGFPPGVGAGPGSVGPRRVPVDVRDRGDAFVVTVDLPGFERENVEVQLVDETLHVGAEQEDASDEEDVRGHYIRRERHHEAASRSVTLPEAVDEDAVTATFSNGVLTVELPKAADAGDAHHIDVE